MKKLFFFIVIFSALVSSCVVMYPTAKEKDKEKPNEYGVLSELQPVFEKPAEYAAIRPDQQPEQDYPTAENWEFYSQKNGTPLRRANADSVGKMFRPDIAALDTTDLNRFVIHSDTAFYKNFYGDSVFIGLLSAAAGAENIYTINGQTPDNDTRSLIVGGNGASDNGYLTFDYSNSYQTAIMIAGGDGSGNTGSVRINSPTQVPAIVVENDNGSFGDVTGTVDGGGFKYVPGTIRIGDPFDIDISGLTINLPLNTTKISESVDNYLQVSSDGTGITGGWADGSGIDIKSASLGTYITQNDLSVNIRGTDNQGSDCLYDILADTTGDLRLLTRRDAGDEQATLSLSTGATGIVSATLQAHNLSAAVVDNFVKVDTGGVEINTKGSPGTAGQVLTSDGFRAYWATGGGGSGTVTSVGLSLPSIFSVSGSPVTTSGTLTGALATQTANTIFAGPTSGGAATPTFRALANADIPVGVGGAWVDGGNSFGATGVFGTNDANPITFEINNISRGTLSTTGVFNVTDVTATTNAIVEKVQAGVNSSGTPVSGFGTGYGFYAKSATVNDRLQGRVNTRWGTVTDVTRTSEMDFTVVSAGVEVVAMTIEGSGDVGIGSTNPLVRLCNGPQPGDGDLVTGAGFGWTVNTAGNTYVAGITNSGTAATSHGLMVESNATDNASRALTVSGGSGPTRIFTVNCDNTVGILDATPESPLDVTGLTKTQHLSGQDLTPTIVVGAAAGTGATASMVNAQSSDLAGRFSITTGTTTTSGLLATITFDDAFAVTPIVIVYNEDADAASILHYVNVSTTGFEFFCGTFDTLPDATTAEFSFIVIGGK